MSAIDSISSSQPASTTDAFAAMGSEDFIRVMFTELTNQDPLSPNETKDLLQQISTLRSIESDINLGKKLEGMARQNEITSASSLVGKFVTGKSEAGQDVAGFVDSVSITSEGSVLNLGSGYRVPLDRLAEVVDPDLLDGANGNEAPLVATAIPDQVAQRNADWDYTVANGTFSDEESADRLTYTATLDDGATLPAWLTFDSRLRRFNGTVPADAPQSMLIKVTAIDSFNARGSTTFRLTFTGDAGSGDGGNGG